MSDEMDWVLWAVREVGRWFAKNNDAFGAAESVATVGAYLTAGWWTWRVFVRQRLHYPRVDVTNAVTHRTLSDGRILVHVSVRLHNHGSTLAPLDTAFVRIQQVLPLADVKELQPLVSGLSGREFSEGIRQFGSALVWPTVAEASKEWDRGACELEPGESETFEVNFVLGGDTECIRVYSFVDNPKKRKRGIGWKAATIYEFQQIRDKAQIGLSDSRSQNPAVRGSQAPLQSAPLRTSDLPDRMMTESAAMRDVNKIWTPRDGGDDIQKQDKPEPIGSWLPTPSPKPDAGRGNNAPPRKDGE